MQLRYVSFCAVLAAAGCGGGDDAAPRDAGSQADGGGMRDGGAAGEDGGAAEDAGGGDAAADDASTGDAGACTPDAPPPEGWCRSEQDCTGAELCRAEGDPPLCGICKPATRECDPNAQTPCGLGGVCIEFTEACACDGPSSACMTDCRTTSGCANEDERCDQTTGLCTADCLSGAVTCPAFATCDPSAADAEANGCVRNACSCDADCGTGACVKGLCRSELGTCQLPPP